MTIKEIMEKKGLSKYKFSKLTGIPYSTICDLVNEKTKIESCTAETVYKVAKSLGVQMEDLLDPIFEERPSFEIFKSNVCHDVKRLGDLKFIYQKVLSGKIRKYYDRGWYPEAFYLLAMVDYLCRENNLPKCAGYDDLREQKLEEPLYSSSILLLDKISPGSNYKERAVKYAIPEFLQYNIVEGEVRDVV